MRQFGALEHGDGFERGIGSVYGVLAAHGWVEGAMRCARGV